MYKKYFKRLFDIILSFIGLIIISPFFCIFAILCLFVNHGSIFYIQERPGMDNKIFKIIKFRTMNNKISSNDMLYSDIHRITKLGRFMRAFSIDELPQLLNVLKGDMSLIGPRPLLIKYIPLYSESQLKRHNVRPGMTGWTQVNGRNALSWHEKFDLDVWYVDHISFLLDIKIFLMTLLKVLSRDGINHSKDVVMRPFKGNDHK